MTSMELEERLSDLIAFQCALVALRGVGAEASDEMLWQALLAALAEQYGFLRVWYGRLTGEVVRPAVIFPMTAPGLEDLPSQMEQSSPILQGAGLVVPVSIGAAVEGVLVVHASRPVVPALAEQIRILVAEACTVLADRRFRARNEEALREAKLQAESASRAKSLLLANMSHEIRTPMTGVLGFAELLAGTELTAEQRDYLDTIRASGKALLTLINDILDFSKIEAGRLNLESAPVDVRQLVEKAVGLLAAQAAGKGLRLGFTIDPSVPAVFAGDVTRLRQVLVNLLGNAVKFTAQGEVSLAVAAAPEQAGKGRAISFIVRDTGPGIAPEDHQRIFDSFSQVDASISRKYGGTGLGLAISRSLACQMGGSLSVESEPGHGAAFHFTVPARAVLEAAQPAAGRRNVPDPRFSGVPPLRIIVAEDNPVNRGLALAFLKRLGCQADTAGNGIELLDHLARASYDVILMDVQMPEMDGLEAARRVRRDWPRGSQPRIIAMTASAFPEDRARCLEAGMDDYVSKPVGLVELADALRRARPSGAGQRPAGRPTAVNG